MKYKYFLVFSFVLQFGFFNYTHAMDVPATVNSYSSTCRYEHPLSTWDGCSDYTRAGHEARHCAEDEAILLCEQKYNTDCIVKGVKYRTIISHEFIGYKACEATVVVHGYRIR